MAATGLPGWMSTRFATTLPSWARRVTLAMLAHAFLAVVRADEHARRPTPDAPIPPTCNEIQRLFTSVVVRPVHGPFTARPTGSSVPAGDAASRRDHEPAIAGDKCD